jgi:hypothetical protein
MFNSLAYSSSAGVLAIQHQCEREMHFSLYNALTPSQRSLASLTRSERVFKAGICSDTLAWNNRVGRRSYVHFTESQSGEMCPVESVTEELGPFTRPNLAKRRIVKLPIVMRFRLQR